MNKLQNIFTLCFIIIMWIFLTGIIVTAKEPIIIRIIAFIFVNLVMNPIPAIRNVWNKIKL